MIRFLVGRADIMVLHASIVTVYDEREAINKIRILFVLYLLYPSTPRDRCVSPPVVYLCSCGACLDLMMHLIVAVMFAFPLSWSTNSLLYELAADHAHPLPENVAVSLVESLRLICESCLYVLLAIFPELRTFVITCFIRHVAYHALYHAAERVRCKGGTIAPPSRFTKKKGFKS